MIRFKIFLIVLSVSFLGFNYSYAQNTLKEGEYSYDGRIFKVEKYNFSKKTSYTVRSIGNFENKRQPTQKDPNSLPLSKKDIHFDIEKVQGIINDVLSPYKKNLGVNKDRVDLHFTFWEKDGSIENISYFLNGNTLISLKDIAEIDKEIKNKIKATFTGKEHTNYILIHYGMVSVNF